MSKEINSMNKIRDQLISTIESFVDGKIDAKDALTVAKVIDSIMNTINIDINYGKYLNKPREIPFMENNGNVIEADRVKKLT